MSPASPTSQVRVPDRQQPGGRIARMGGKEFEEAFKPKAKGPLPDKAAGGKDGKKKKKWGIFKLLLFVGVPVLLIAAGAAAYFLGALDPVLETVGLKKSPEEVTIEERIKVLDRRAAELDNREKALDELKAQLDEQAAELAKQREEMKAKAEEEAGKSFEQVRSELSEDKLAELKQVGSIYSRMDPAAAAAIMSKLYDARQIAVIVYFMQPNAAAALLAGLDPEVAAEVTRILAS